MTISLQAKELCYYDSHRSSRNTGHQYLSKVLTWLRHVISPSANFNLYTPDFSTSIAELPYQIGSHDCGVFIMVIGECLLKELPPEYMTQRQVAHHRQRITY
jgi:Ulp1 family protease